MRFGLNYVSVGFALALPATFASGLMDGASLPSPNLYELNGVLAVLLCHTRSLRRREPLARLIDSPLDRADGLRLPPLALPEQPGLLGQFLLQRPLLKSKADVGMCDAVLSTGLPTMDQLFEEGVVDRLSLVDRRATSAAIASLGLRVPGLDL